MMNLTLKQANTIIEAALAKAREMKIRPLAMVVLDDSGNVKADAARRRREHVSVRRRAGSICN